MGDGADVTMVQRTSTHIVRSETLMDIGLGALYSQEAVESGVTTEKADLIFASLPYRILPEFQIPLYDQMRERDADYYKRLEDAGFDLDWGEDDSGLFMKYLRRGSGYYIDVGASELVADGKIKLQNGQVDHLTEDSVVMEDGTELPQQEGLWFHGGNLHQSRHYSQFLALQLKARAEGIDTPVYGLQEVHHLS